MKGWAPLVLAVLIGKYGGDFDGLKSDASWLVDRAQNVEATEILGGVELSGVLMPLSLAFAVVGLVLLVAYVTINRSYRSLTKDNAINVDAWVQEPEGPSFGSRVKLLFTNWMSAGGHTPSTVPVLLGEQDSTFMENLKVTVKQGEVGSYPHKLTTRRATRGTVKAKQPIVVGTIRMGFGHHRIAYAACSWSLDRGSETYFHDFLNIDCPEAQLIKDMDKLYSKGSRWASELGGPVEKLWGALTLSGDADSLRATYQMGEVAKPLLMDLPRDTPIIATHCLVGLCAVACGFTNVINLVIDNHAQWFIVVPGALNLVQGPTNYAQLLKMGVPADEIQLAGHWIPKDLVVNLNHDCTARIQRAKKGKPLRLLIPVGGAGAQRKFVSNLVKELAPLVKQGLVQLFLNAGDHEHMRVAFIKALDSVELGYDVVDSIQGVHDFCEKLRMGKEPNSPVTLFAFKDYFPAVATTDIVCRVTDILACKPSELAFYPVPKLMIRRVGDHEAYAALRASELGDGTLEARTVKDALRYVELFREPEAPLLVSMNERIMENGKIGLYDGCKNAVDIAREMM